MGMVDEAPGPGDLSQTDDAAEVRSISRWHRWMEERSSVGCALLVAVLVIVVLVWGFVAFR